MTQNIKPTHFRSGGDVNTTPARQAWNASMDDERTQALLKRDSEVFLHQAMSTPCLDTLEAAEGIYIQDATGKKYMDFHGNNVHQLGYGHPHVIKRVQEQIAKLPATTYDRSALLKLKFNKSWEIRPGRMTDKDMKVVSYFGKFEQSPRYISVYPENKY